MEWIDDDDGSDDLIGPLSLSLSPKKGFLISCCLRYNVPDAFLFYKVLSILPSDG